MKTVYGVVGENDFKECFHRIDMFYKIINSEEVKKDAEEWKKNKN